MSRCSYLRTVDDPTPQAVFQATCGYRAYLLIGETIEVLNGGEDGYFLALGRDREFTLAKQIDRKAADTYVEWFNLELMGEFSDRIDEDLGYYRDPFLMGEFEFGSMQFND